MLPAPGRRMSSAVCSGLRRLLVFGLPAERMAMSVPSGMHCGHFIRGVYQQQIRQDEIRQFVFVHSAGFVLIVLKTAELLAQIAFTRAARGRFVFVDAKLGCDLCALDSEIRHGAQLGKELPHHQENKRYGGDASDQDYAAKLEWLSGCIYEQGHIGCLYPVFISGKFAACFMDGPAAWPYACARQRPPC